MNLLHKLPRNSEVIDTNKTPDEIRELVIRNTRKYDPWDINKDKSHDFTYKIDANMIYLNSLKNKYWPNVELELREFTEPRLKVKYGGFIFYKGFYMIIAVLMIIADFQLSDTNQLIGFIFTMSALISLPWMAAIWQANVKIWLMEKLKIDESPAQG